MSDPDPRLGSARSLYRYRLTVTCAVTQHVHALVLDGVAARDGDGDVRFYPLSAPADADVAAVLATARRRILRLLQRRGLLDAPDGFVAVDELADASPVLAGISAASVMGTAALGPRAGRRVRRCGEPRDRAEPDGVPPGPRQARIDGFDLHANVIAPAGDRGRLERLCRYALRPPVTQDRIQVTGDGQVMLQLRRRWSDGTTHLVFDPVELLERLAAITPRPRVNLILYHGVLAPRAKWRPLIVPGARPTAGATRASATHACCVQRGAAQACTPSGRPRGSEDARKAASDRKPIGASGDGRLWADLMRRTFGYDVLTCPRWLTFSRRETGTPSPGSAGRDTGRPGHLEAAAAEAAPPARALEAPAR